MNNSSENPGSSTQTAMIVGAYTGILMVIIPAITVLYLALIGGGIYYAIRKLKKQMGGEISFSKAWIVGIQTSFFASVILAFMIYIYAQVVNPSIVDIVSEQYDQMVRSFDIPVMVADNLIHDMKEINSPTFLALSVLTSYSIIGLIISCICAYFLKKPANQGANSRPL